MENSYLPNVPEKNPAPPARQSTVCGADLIYISICSGGVIIKISAAGRAWYGGHGWFPRHRAQGRPEGPALQSAG
jgi:hypothetical protein